MRPEWARYMVQIAKEQAQCYHGIKAETIYYKDREKAKEKYLTCSMYTLYKWDGGRWVMDGAAG